MFSDDLLSDHSNWSDDSNSNSEYEEYLAASDEEHDDSVLPVKFNSSENNAGSSKENDISSKFGDLSLQPASTSSTYTPDMTVRALSSIQCQNEIKIIRFCLYFLVITSSVAVSYCSRQRLPTSFGRWICCGMYPIELFSIMVLFF